MESARLLWPLGIWSVVVVLQELLVLPHVPDARLDLARLSAWAVAVVAAAAVAAARWQREAPTTGAPPVDEPTGPDIPGEPLRDLAVEAMSEGVVALDRDGRVVFANRSAREMLGLKDLPDGVPMHVLGPLPQLRTTVVEAWRDDRVVVRELSLAGHRKGALLVRVTPSVEGAVVVMLDVTELRRLEAGWRRFVGDSAHELRTPVAAIKANLEMLTEIAELPEGPSGLLGRAFRQAERLGALVEQLSRLARLDEGEPLRIVPVALRQVLVEIVQERGAADAEAATRIQTDLCDGLAMADREGLQRVVENLLSNALRYSAGPVVLRSRLEDGEARVEVEDRGAGVPEEARDRVFDRFYRLQEGRERAAGGTGLGLSIARELAQAMGGQVALEPASPHGTLAVVTLPAARADLPPLPG